MLMLLRKGKFSFGTQKTQTITVSSTPHFVHGLQEDGFLNQHNVSLTDNLLVKTRYKLAIDVLPKANNHIQDIHMVAGER